MGIEKKTLLFLNIVSDKLKFFIQSLSFYSELFFTRILANNYSGKIHNKLLMTWKRKKVVSWRETWIF